MNGKAHGQLRRSQVITTFGPGALIDLPEESAIVGGLDTWGSETDLEPIDEPRLAAKLTSMTGVQEPRLYAPPPEPDHWQDRQRGIGAWRFPEWFVVQESIPGSPGQAGSRSRRMVRRTALDRGKFDKRPVVATRFRPRLLAGPRGQHRLAPVRPRAGRPMPASTQTGRKRHQRRSGGADRTLRVRQVAPHARGDRYVQAPSRHLQRAASSTPRRWWQTTRQCSSLPRT